MTTRALLLTAVLCSLGCDSAATQEPVPSEPPAARQSPSGDEAAPEASPPMTDRKPDRMTDRKPQTHISGATDAVLSGDDTDDALEVLLDGLTDADQTGLRIDAPFVVDAGATALPVVGAFVRVPEAGEAFENEVAVIATQGDAITVQPALRSPKMKGGKKRPASDVIRGSNFAFDALARLSSVDFAVPTRLWVGYGPYLSNGVTVRVGGEAPLAPGGSTSVSLEGPSSAPTEPGGTVTLSGTAPASTQVHIVALGGPDAFVSAVEADGAGSFSVNLLGDNPLPKAPGTWHVYAFCGEHVAGPVSIELTPGSKPW